MAPGLLSQTYQEADVVDRDQPQAQDVFDYEQVPQISAGIRGTGLAVAGRVEGRSRVSERGASHIEPAARKPCRSMPAVPGGCHAVKEIDSSSDSFQQIRGKTDPHKITGNIGRQCGVQSLEDAMHYRFGLADRKATNRDAGPGAALQRALE